MLRPEYWLPSLLPLVVAMHIALRRYYLNNAVYLFEEMLKEQGAPPEEYEVDYGAHIGQKHLHI